MTGAMTTDVRLILGAQGVRAFGYGFGAVLLGTSLDHRGLSPTEAGVVLAAVVAGSAVASLTVGRWGDRWGRRRTYAGLYLLLALAAAVFAEISSPWVLAPVGLTGVLSTEVLESGPFSSLEQAMLASGLSGRSRLRGFGVYNAVAAGAGSIGALASGLPDAVARAWSGAPSEADWFWLLAPVALVGAVLAGRLSAEVEAPQVAADGGLLPRAHLAESRTAVQRLSLLFATDSFGGGFAVQSFIAFWLTRRFDTPTGTIGVIFFAVGVLQTLSFLVATRLAERIGLLRTMVFTHLPSNVLLASIAFAPNLPVAVALLLGRVALSQMDVPTRQAYVMALVQPHERTAAAAYTSTARYAVRPVGPAVGGALSSVWLGAPFLVAGVIKGGYDVALWLWFRRVELPEDLEP